LKSKQLVSLLALLTMCLSSGCADLGYQVWLEDSLVKIFPDDTAPIQSDKPFVILIPRNGHASLQVAVRPERVLNGFSISAEVESAPLEISVSRVGYVPVNRNTPESPEGEVIRTAPAEFPDPLFPDIPDELSAGRTEAFWLTLFAPASTEPGEYSAEVRVQGGGSGPSILPFTVRALSAMVPEDQKLKVTNWFSFSEDRFALHYGSEGEGEKFWRIVGNIGRVMAEHKQNVILTPVSDLVAVTFEGRKYQFDFSDFDRWVDMFTEVGVIGTIEGGHLLTRPKGYFSPVGVPGWVQENGELVWKLLAPDDPRASNYLSSFLSALYEHLQARGLTQQYVQHLHDEPHGDELPIYEKYAALVKKHMPGIPIIDAVDLDEDMGFLNEYLDIWVPVLSSFDDKFGVLQSHREKGGGTWYYTCVNPQGRYLNRFLDYSLVKMRLLHWFNFRHELSGYLHWGGNYWSEEPFRNVEPVINDGQTLLPPGDNALIYPDPENESILSSIRLEIMREGIEDYELLADLAGSSPERADELVRKAIPNVNDYIRDHVEFRRLYEAMLEAADGE
jgi:hypothetical protein